MSDYDASSHRGRSWALGAAVLPPPLLLAGLGVLHPKELDDGSAHRWTVLHLVLLPVFPLLAVAPWLVARRSSRVAGRAALLRGVVFALFYTAALDVLAGIGTGVLQQFSQPGGVPVLFQTGNELSLVGVYAYLAATLLAAGVALRHARWSALPGAVVRRAGRGVVPRLPRLRGGMTTSHRRSAGPRRAGPRPSLDEWIPSQLVTAGYGWPSPASSWTAWTTDPASSPGMRRAEP